MVIAGGQRTATPTTPTLRRFNGAGDGDRRRGRHVHALPDPLSLQRSRRW